MKTKLQKLSRPLLYWLSVSIFGVVIGFSLQFAKAWTEPGSAAPNGNVGGPLTTGNPGQTKSGGLRLNTGGAANGLIVDTGNVGLGIANPAANLHVAVDDNDTDSIRISNKSASGSYYLNMKPVTTLGVIRWVFNLHNDKTNYPNMLAFDRGNIGIGTTDPEAKLDVNGQIAGGFGAATTGGVKDWNDASNARSGNGETLLLGNDANGPAPSGYFHPFGFEYNSKNGSGNITQLAIPYGNGSVNQGLYMRGRFNNAWTNWMRILSENTVGNVGIGTTNPKANMHIAVDDTDADSFRISAKGTALPNPPQDAYYLNLKPITTNGVIRWAFNQMNQGVNYPNAMVFKNGMIGMGMSEPTSQLEIKGRFTAKTPDYSTNTIVIGARDVASFGREDLYINWENGTGDVYIGHENGESKIFGVTGNIVASESVAASTFKFSDGSMQSTALETDVDTNLCKPPVNDMCGNNYYMRGVNSCCPFNAQIADVGDWQLIPSVTIAVSNDLGYTWSAVYDNQFTIPSGKKVTGVKVAGDADDGGYCYAYWGTGRVAAFVHGNTSVGTYNLDDNEYYGTYSEWQDGVGWVETSSTCPQNPAFFDNNGTVRICQSAGAKGSIGPKLLTGLNILENNVIHLKGQNVDGPHSGVINCQLYVKYENM